MGQQIPGSPYGRAIFEVAVGRNELDVVHADFQSLLKLLEESKDFAAFIRARSLDQSRARILERIFAEALHPLTLKFLKFLADKNRLEIIQPVIQEFIELYREKKGTVHLEVTSYGPLDDATLEQIKAKWNQRLGKGIELNFKIDRSILGGVMFKVKDHVHDYSIKAQLEQLHEQLTK